MSGTMQPQMQPPMMPPGGVLPGAAPPMQGGAPMPPGMPPQAALPPQIAPRVPPPGSPGAPMPPPAAPSMPPGMNPALAMFGRAAQGEAPQQGQMRLTPAEMARLGRNGDSLIAHLTPGEIAVPPQVQTPKVLATLNNAFHKAGVQPEQFTAGSPQSSQNPQTGAPEYNFLSAILPMVFGAGASFLAPWAMPGLFGAGGALAGGAGQALAGGLGSALGSVVGGGNGNQALMAGLGGAAGNFFGGGGLSGSAAPAANAATTAAAGSVPSNLNSLSAATLGGQSPIDMSMAANAASNPVTGGAGMGAAAGAVPTPSTFSNMFGGDFGGLKRALYTGAGAGIGQSLAPANPTPTPLPPGFSNRMPAINPNYNQILGNSNSPTPSFNNYNPIAAVTGTGYNFYQPVQPVMPG